MELPVDVIIHMLQGNMGASTYAMVRRVSRSWYMACNDARVIDGVIEYTGGLTRTQFRGLIRLTHAQACSYPCATRHSGLRTFYLYTPDTVRHALRELGGVQAISTRDPPSPWRGDGAVKRRASDGLEARLHRRKMLRLASQLHLENTDERIVAWRRVHMLGAC